MLEDIMEKILCSVCAGSRREIKDTRETTLWLL